MVRHWLVFVVACAPGTSTQGVASTAPRDPEMMETPAQAEREAAARPPSHREGEPLWPLFATGGPGNLPDTTVAPIATEPRDCGAAHDHCLPAGTWFADTVRGFEGYAPVYVRGGRFYTWKDGAPVEEGNAYRTIAGTAATVLPHHKVMFEHHERASEADALLHSWYMTDVWDVDAAKGTFTSTQGEFAIDAVRVIVDERTVK